jgi:hypothetical protein
MEQQTLAIISRLSGKPLFLLGISVVDAAALTTLLCFYPTLTTISSDLSSEAMNLSDPPSCTLHLHLTPTLVYISSTRHLKFIPAYIHTQFTNQKLTLMLEQNNQPDLTDHAMLHGLISSIDRAFLADMRRVSSFPELVSQLGLVEIPDSIVHACLYEHKAIVYSHNPYSKAAHTTTDDSIDAYILMHTAHHISTQTGVESWVPYVYQPISSNYLYLYLARLDASTVIAVLANGSGAFESCAEYTKTVAHCLNVQTTVPSKFVVVFPIRIKIVLDIERGTYTQYPSTATYITQLEEVLIAKDIDEMKDELMETKSSVLRRGGWVVVGVKVKGKACILVLDGSVCVKDALVICTKALDS